MTSLQAHKNYIFLQEIPQTGDSKIIIPPIFQRNAETVKRGVVKYCGPQSHVQVGETVIFDKWSGSALEFKGQKLLIIQSNSIVAVEGDKA